MSGLRSRLAAPVLATALLAGSAAAAAVAAPPADPMHYHGSPAAMHVHGSPGGMYHHGRKVLADGPSTNMYHHA